MNLDKKKESEYRKRLLGLHNYGFDKVERLPGNIGYHKTVKFFETDIAGRYSGCITQFFSNYLVPLSLT